MNSSIKYIIETFDFNSVSRQKKQLNIYSELKNIKQQLDGVLLDGVLYYNGKIQQYQYDILTSVTGFYKVSSKRDLDRLICYFTVHFGNECNLNWIDVSGITEMEDLFYDSDFNGDISKWDVSNVTNMRSAFRASSFKGDISEWDVSNVLYMNNMFQDSPFNGDISKWDVSNVVTMKSMFYNAVYFKGDLNGWKINDELVCYRMFDRSPLENNPPKWYNNKLNEGFEFDSIDNKKKNFNIYKAELVKIEELLDKRQKLEQYQYEILIKFPGFYKVHIREDLKDLIRYFIGMFGKRCSLNWIDTSELASMSFVFADSDFNGDISKWDVSNVTNMQYMFSKSKFNSDISGWDVSKVTNMCYMFQKSLFNSDISKWDVSNVTNMHGMFSYTEFNGDISSWDVSNVKDMSYMFLSAQFNSDISKWNVGNVTTMKGMFRYAAFNGDISKWNVPMNTDITDIFFCAPLELRQNLPGWYKEMLNEGFDFNSVGIDKKKVNVFNELDNIKNIIDTQGKLEQYQYDLLTTKNGIGIYKVFNRRDLINIIDYFTGQFGYTCNLNWIDTSAIRDMSFLFESTDFNGDISKWDVSNVINMTSMFEDSKFDGDISEWDVSKVKNMKYMFSKSKFEGNISKWDVSNVTDMHSMFAQSSFFGDISNWDVGNVEDMQHMFIRAIFNGDISKWDVSKVKNMKYMFAFSNFSGNIDNWKVGTDTNIDDMFLCSHFEENPPKWVKKLKRKKFMKKLREFISPKGIDESFDFNKVNGQKRNINIYEELNKIQEILDNHKYSFLTEAQYQMLTGLIGFYRPDNRDHLQEIIARFSERFGNDCDLNWIDVSHINTLNYLFYTSAFNGDISKWDVSNVWYMQGMFENSKFNGDISNWDVSSVTNMYAMFAYSEFNGDISKWDVSKCTDMRLMFKNSKFDGDISKWDVSNVDDMASMFCNSKFSGDISDWDVSNVHNMYQMFTGAENFNCDLNRWNTEKIQFETYMQHMFEGSGLKYNPPYWYKQKMWK